MKEVRKLKSLIEFHRSRGLLPPQHPLISVVDYADVRLSPENNNVNWVFDFYSISLKRNVATKLKYGQQQYDFDEGILFFIAPGQVFNVEVRQGKQDDKSGWMLLVHPDFFWNAALAKKIKHYEFFDYSVNEALFLSDTEESILNGIIQNIRQEHHSNIDKFCQDIIISQIETLLNYSERFYQRQFITRKITNHQILDRMESFLNSYYEADDLSGKGLPTVKFLTEELNISPGYLSRLLKDLTGLSTMQHIQNKIIEESKIKLSTSDLSISEIAYQLGFEHSQSFSKLFKAKTNLSPVEFRSSFN
ncbi:helix-turn-helix domain-containing protein [Chryseobacterium fluminis]|uniref:helix-turn-helix domain-containing protein n=1 Tax=Chryseobacterium fluminis TaxID=2983606 RepID=UPI002255E6F4|nr:helix-turn-helix domain-containing protein [Chryseobacterium sp. MMS21-Ot14]UZT99032.1 helix-turn-helix domain-containing protein [Chryseobacterium sp. MMS21-Ot14]